MRMRQGDIVSDDIPAGHYAIDYDRREIRLDFFGHKKKVPFDLAFHRAVNTRLRIEDDPPATPADNLYLAIYDRYLKKAPRPVCH